MLRFFVGMFIVLHGLVHLWYFTLSRGLVAFQPEMGWSGYSWLLSPLFGSSTARTLSSTLYVVATLAFLIAGAGFVARAGWTQPVLIGAALLSSALIVIFWEGGFQMWMEKGLIGLLVNVALLVALWLARTPSFAS